MCWSLSGALLLSSFYMCLSAVHSCLIISEVNCDNPSFDTKEFVELFSLSAGSTSLDGYTLVFYNGNGNVAYRVIDLSGHSTDERGFFLIGSAELKPSPAIQLPPNSIQNGPDAIALYGPSWVPVAENGNVSAIGLLDAVVYTSRRVTGTADVLSHVLTPGSFPYVEDDQFSEGDESIQRCWLSDNHYSFQNAVPTPGRPNICPPSNPGHLWINRIQLSGGTLTGPVEISVGEERGEMTMVVYNTQTDTVKTSVSFQASKTGNVSVNLNTTLSDSDGWALAVYQGSVKDFQKGNPLNPLQPLDAFVCTGLTNTPSASLTETLIPGRKAFKLDSRFSEGDAYITRCGTAHWARDPGVFQHQIQRPSESIQCKWYNTCPYNTALNMTDEPLEPWSDKDGDFLISEVNVDSPGSAEDEEFVELWHPSGRRTSLNDIWILLINGNNGKIYREIELDGFYTDHLGYFLIGSDKLKPHVALPANTIQNGPDAIAIYRSTSAPSLEDVMVPKNGLLDGIVYRSRSSDRDWAELVKALTPGQLPLLEDTMSLEGDESLSRCALNRVDLNSFRVSSPTPMKENDCPRPPKELVINEVGGVLGTDVFVELIGPPLAPLHGMVIVLNELNATTRHVIPLKGGLGNDGFFLMSNDSRADQNLPAVASLGAVWLCYGLPSVCSSESKVQDLLLLSNKPSLHPFPHRVTHQVVYPVASFDSVSRCAMNRSAAWTASHPTPRRLNLCPNSTYSVHMDLCLEASDSHITCTEEGFAELLERSCQCGISGAHLAGVNLTCISERLYAEGPVFSLSSQQRELVAQTLQKTQTLSCSIVQERLYNKESALGLQVGLVLTVVLLCALGGAIFFYLYKKKRPQDYYSMELNEHDSPMDL
ncbi:uncharacterized protein si:ch211-183d21.1 [Hemibagrus wyckioides]|uniref:uncharacterized protein si:ch211-183d21.1 n=1 Tax=Hemibagrus wyckioides TaxID=337641 RepID=UPI00266CF009|nr:uncharacterized protein si:ch211-183d21.1 [Hemibagrus wyckioides]XP_058254014.1 uncharacterized protein si:ch211-183d21.1 [Hemibagrus wyckioides]